MADYLEQVINIASDPAAEPRLRSEIHRWVSEIKSSSRGCDRQVVAVAEDVVRRNPTTAFEFDEDGGAVLCSEGSRWAAGHFEVASVGDLRARVATGAGRRSGHIRLSVLDGASPATDIGALQAYCGTGTLFQVASQFNCLESPGPHVTNVANYFGDSTQGPRASVSAFPATLLRHYRAPGPGCQRFVQTTDGAQIDLIADACGRRVSRNGYFTGADLADPQSISSALERNFEAICVGVHSGAEVVLGYNWDGAVPTPPCCIAQVFTSTVAGGGYGGERSLGKADFEATSRQLLRAAYLGTLLAAVALGRRRVVLTLIGGGVFRNRIEIIWEAVQWAIDEVERVLDGDLDVVVNGYNLGNQLDLDRFVVPVTRKHGGAVVTFDNSGVAEVKR